MEKEEGKRRNFCFVKKFIWANDNFQIVYVYIYIFRIEGKNLYDTYKD